MAEGDYEITIWRRVAGTYVTYTNVNNNNRVISRNWIWNENYPKEFTFKVDNPVNDATKNMLSSSFAGWSSGTGALAMGDLVHYKLKTNASPGTFLNLLWGKIVKLEPVGNALTVMVKCFATTLENHREDFVYFKSYRDQMPIGYDNSEGLIQLTDLTDANVQVPLALVEFALTDIRKEYGEGAGYDTFKLWDEGDSDYFDVAQAFVADGNGLLAVIGLLDAFDFDSAIGTLYCGLYANNPLTNTPNIDDSNYVGHQGDAFGDTAIAFKSKAYTAGMGNHNFEFDFINSSEPLRLEKGQKYWVVLHWVDNGSTSDVNIAVDDANAGEIIHSHYYRDYDTAWQLGVGFGKNIKIKIDQADYEEVKPDKYMVNLPHVCLHGVGGSITEIGGTSYSFCRGRLSYYYGVREFYEVAEFLTEYANPLLTAEASLSMVEDIKTFTTRGKSRGDCMRELADLTESGGSWSGYQHAFGHYNSNWGTPMSGTNKLKFNKRYKTSDSSYATFSHALDAATDQEARIISHKLKNTVNERPYLMRLIGKGSDGQPLVLSKHDLASANSLGIAIQGFAPVQSSLDESLTALADVNTKVDCDINAVRRNTWAGSITLAGVFPELMQLDDAGDYYGSGRIITLNYSPLGISATKFKVTGVEVGAFTTTVHLTNMDILLKNFLTNTVKKANMTEGFYAPVGLPDVFYIMVYDDTPMNDAGVVYMHLCTADDTPITGMTQVQCTKFANTVLNLNVFHAEFEAANGFTVDGTPVTRIEIWDDSSPQVELAQKVIANDSMSFPKWKSLRVIVDYTCPIA